MSHLLIIDVDPLSAKSLMFLVHPFWLSMLSSQRMWKHGVVSPVIYWEIFWSYLTPRSCGGCTSGPQEPDVSTCPWPPSMLILPMSLVRNMHDACCMLAHESRFTFCREDRSVSVYLSRLLHSIHCTHWSSSRDWTFFLYQAFRPCQKFCMTCRKILRCVATFSLGNFRR